MRVCKFDAIVVFDLFTCSNFVAFANISIGLWMRVLESACGCMCNACAKNRVCYSNDFFLLFSPILFAVLSTIIYYSLCYSLLLIFCFLQLSINIFCLFHILNASMVIGGNLNKTSFKCAECCFSFESQLFQLSFYWINFINLIQPTFHIKMLIALENQQRLNQTRVPSFTLFLMKISVFFSRQNFNELKR